MASQVDNYLVGLLVGASTTAGLK